MPDGVCVVLAGLHEKPLEVVCRWPHWTLVTVHGDRYAPHAEAICLPVMVIIADGQGRSPLKALFVPLVAAIDALLGAVSSFIGWRLLIAARRRTMPPYVG
jgi:hypothetical protein